MVERDLAELYKNDYEEYVKVTDEMARKEAEAFAKECAPLLHRLGSIMKTKLEYLSDLSSMETATIKAHVQDIGRAIAEEKNPSVSVNTVWALLLNNAHADLDFDTLARLFEVLPTTKTGDPNVRGAIGQRLSNIVTRNNVKEFLELVKHTEPTADRWSLLYGFPKIKDKKYAEDMIGLLREALHDPGSLWPAAEVAKKKKHFVLLPDLREALKLTNDKEARRVIQRSINYLEAHKPTD